MTRALIVGNWKMNLNRKESQYLASAVVQQAEVCPAVELVVCPPTVHLVSVAEVIAPSKVRLGAQNMYHRDNGAFTGEVSARMLRDVNCRYVILGHSERRHLLGETNEQVNLKTLAAIEAGLTPIVCVGEQLQDRQAGRTYKVIAEQCQHSLAHLSSQQITRIVIAYEPVWAIGTGKVATPEQAEEVHGDLRKMLEERYNIQIAYGVRLLYGGSVKSDNAGVLLSQPNVDGALVGGASLEAGDFCAIATAGSHS